MTSVASPSARARHALDARDAVVDGDEQIGPARGGEVHQLRRKPVTEHPAVRNEVVHARAEGGERAHADGAGAGAIGVVIGDDEDAFLRRDRVRKERGRALAAEHRLRRREAREAVRELLRRADVARSVESREQRMQSGGGKVPPGGFGDPALDDLHAALRTHTPRAAAACARSAADRRVPSRTAGPPPARAP